MIRRAYTGARRRTRCVVLSFVFCAIASAFAGAFAQERESPSAEAGVDYGEEVSRFVYDPDEIVSVLKNGMVVIVKRVPSPVVTIRGYARTGGVYEGRWLGGGLSHLLEHLVAGGTNDRRSEAQNRDLLQQIGNNSNAYTSSSHTAYYVNTTPDNLEKGVDLVSGWMLGAHITPDEYRREYEVVQRELEKGEGEPDRVFYYAAQRNRYQVSPARVPVIGYQEVIQGLSRDEVYEYYKLAYVPNNMVFALAGDVPPEQMLAAVKKFVKDAPPGRVFDHNIPDEPPVMAPRTNVATFPALGQAKLALGFPTVKLGHPDMYPLDLLATVLGTGQGSLLVQELRDRRGLISSVQAYDDTPDYVDGTFQIQMELETDKLAEAAAAVLEILEAIKSEGIDPDRLERAKTQTKTSRAFDQQTSENVAESRAIDWMSTGDPHFSDRYVERMERVTVEQIKDVARRYLDPSRLLTTAMLPEEAVAEAGGLAKAAEFLRKATPATAEAAEEKDPADVVRVGLKDGTTLLLKRVDQAPVVVMSMYSLGGVTAEDAKTNGLGMLAMQLTSRGTKGRSAQQIAEFFDSVGGQVVGSCGNNTWSWTAQCLKEDFGKTLEVFTDVVRNPVFPEDETELMKRRIAAAIASQDADWMSASMRFFRRSYFGPKNSPYQFLAVGTRENVQSFTPQQVRQWYSDKVLKAPRVLAVYGDIDVEQARIEIARRFGGEGESASQAPKTGKSPAGRGGEAGTPSLTVREVKVNRTDNPETGVVIGFDAPVVVGSEVLYPLTVADTLASGYNYPTGYIFETLRRRGLVYDAQAYVFPGRSTQTPGAFIAYAGCDAKDVNEVVDLMLENVARLQGKPEEINVDWFGRTRNLIVTSEALDNETASQQAQTAALDELFGLGYDYHDRFAGKIEAVKLEDVQSIARRLLRECVVTVTTNDPDAVQIKTGPRTYDSFPPVDLAPKGVVHDSK